MRALAATLFLAATTVATIPSPSAEAQSWPQRNVRLVLPFGAGSSTDIMARLLAERFQGIGKKEIPHRLAPRDDHHHSRLLTGDMWDSNRGRG